MSNLPPRTREFLFAEGSWVLPGFDDLACEGAKFHSPRPLFTTDVPLALPSWGPGVVGAAPRATLCGTCRDNLNVLLQMLGATEGSLDWAIRREFGNDLRALALKGWHWYAERYRPVEASEPAPKG